MFTSTFPATCASGRAGTPGAVVHLPFIRPTVLSHIGSLAFGTVQT